MSMSVIAVLVVFPAVMAYAAASDIVSMTISNKLCLFLVAGFALCAAAVGLSWTALAWHLAAGMLVLAVSFGLFARGWIGGGDAKLAAATALWFGFEPLLAYILIASFAGGILTLALLKLRTLPLPSPALGWSWARRLHDKDEGIPYGVALAFAALAILPQTPIWRAAIGI
jgi:prepilin peptidase CpaA